MHLGRDIWADVPAAAAPTLVKKQGLVTADGSPDPMPTVIAPHSSTQMTAPGGTLVKATGAASMTDSILPTETITAPPPPLNSDPSSDGNGGISTGAQAGIAFGVLGGFFVIGLIVYFIFSRRRKQAEERRRQEDKEKVPDLTDFGPAVTSRDLPSTPVERLAVDKPLPLPVATLDPKAPRASTYSNPFDNEFDAVSSIHPSDRSLAMRSRSPSPISLDEALPRPPVPTAITTDRVAPLARKASLRNGPTVAPALSGAFDFEFSSNPFGNGPFGNEHAIGAFISEEEPPTPTDGPVHRVQLDFKPTLEDEMSLKAGQLVRLLHEFDDGWALCSRFDKSEQGVIPRTCLSARPVRPRQESNADARPGSRPGPGAARR
ncbi:hypothetical protein B0I35DRAFT_472838 [Stachybotrys elegans]|uniref:SH3 domain-containing protein n=1 Tax=Stachybotrys elegans TaxID=80388 RepID=A0A8K0T0N2_9HYPO|nr:hypothetical protein B0I35DRAFT_472838 [Stachybotrys elegans]